MFLKEPSRNLEIKHIANIYTIYTCIISLDGTNSILDSEEINISRPKSNQTEAQRYFS
jgi:hypothetical protein